MNEEIFNFRDKSIRRLLAEAVAPTLLVDSEIEAMLTSADLTTPLSDEQLHRLLGKVQGLIETADDADRTVTSTALPAVVVSQSTHHASEPRLVVVSTTEVPLRSNRKAAVASLLASLLALISVVVLSSNVPVPRAISQNDQRSKLQGTLLTDLQRRLALPRTVPYQMTAKQRPETPPVGKVAVGDEISTGERERRRVSLPDGSVLYVNNNAHVKIVNERRVEVTKGEVFVEVVPTFSEPHGASVQATVDTAPAADAVPLRFEVITPERTITALGTKFAVTVEEAETDVTVTQGKVKVSGVGELVTAGKQLMAAGEIILTAARSTSSQLEWTRDLMAAATGSLVAKSEYSGGALVTVDPHGQSSKLSLRNYHIDVHIEDGFARTTIDQTYFNHTHSRLEGTFHFPLPTDASLSRLAMYVNGKLMEGGMAERNHARNTFEEIKRKMLDPALLEWVDGSTFKMRVFPLEPRQEKRIVLSYSQRLLSNDGQLSYRFPAGHTMDAVRDWSAHVVVKGAAGTEWRSQSHAMTVKNDGDDLVLDAVLKNALLDQDLVLRVAENTNLKSQISNYKYDGQQYLMLRLRPELAGDMQRKPHHWVFIFEQAGDRTPLLARTQIEIIRTLLENAEHSDTFSIVTASSRAALYADEPLLCSAENIAAAVKYLENVHLVGALDLAAGLKASGWASALRGDATKHGGLTPNRSPVLVHVGSGMPALGERDAAKLAAMIPENWQYIGIGVGHRWNEAMMKQAASRTGGLSTQINPDEDIAWRAFELFNKLHLPRLVNVECWTAFSSCSDKNKAMRLGPDGLPHPLPVASATGIDPHRMESPEGATEVLCGKLCRAFSPLVFFGASPGSHGPGIGYVGPSGPESQAVARGAIAHGGLTPNRSPDQSDDSNESRFLLFSDTVTQGEELAAICRIPEGQPLPQEITVTATLNGQPWSQTVAVNDVKEDASYLPRHWAKLEIDRLLAENATANRETIVALSKSMYVMSPFTSLLVLENDEMYTQLNVDRGRKDHWALYACPETIEVVVENGGEAAVPAASLTTSNGKTPSDVMSTVARLPGASYVPMDTPRLMTLDPTSAVHTLRNLNSNDGISAPVFKANVVVNGVFVLGTDNQILQTRQVISQLDGNHHDYGNHSDPWIPQIADPELLNRYVRDINVVYDDNDLLIKRTIPFGRFQIKPGDLADPRRIRRGRTPLTEDKLSYFSGNALASDSDDLIHLKVQQQHFGLEHGWRTHESYSMSQQRTVGTHRWAADNVDFDAALVTLPTFQTEADDSFAINPTMFGDLMSYAPGLNTSATDVMAVVECESSIANLKSEISDPPGGRVDDAARGLIEKARGRGWESITIGVLDNEPGITILYDGQGRHVWERVVSEGLREHVVCDGETLWHLYREIGLASKRPFSRFHHQEFSDIVPWLLPSVEELSRGADVVALDDRTVAVVPQTKSVPSPPGKGEKVADRPDEGAASGDASSNPTSGEEPQNPLTLTLSPESGERGQSLFFAAGERGQSQLFAVHLVFANDGRLAERRIVERDGGKVLRRITYDADGLVRVLDGDGKELIAAKFNRSIAPQPQLVPDLHGLVVLPMPVRKPSVIVARATDRDGKVDADQDLAEDDAISLMLAYMANGNGARVVEIARNRFLNNGDTRDGFYVLLSRFPMALVQAPVPGAATGNGKSQSTPGLTTQGFDLRPPVEGSLLKQFVRQYVNWLRDSAVWQPGSGVIAEFRLDAPEGSFLQRLATARNMYVRWLTDAATKDLTQAQVQQEINQTLEFIATCRTLDMGWALMNTMRPRLTRPEHLAAFATAAERFERHPQVGLLVRRERMTALLEAGKHDEAMTLFKEWLSVQLQQCIVPPIGKAFYDSLTADNYQQTMNKFLLAEANRLADSGLLMTLNSFAVQMRELGNVRLADQMMTKLLASLNTQERPDVSLYAIEQLWQMKDARADKLLDQVMQQPMANQIPSLWRFASRLAEESGRKRLAAERLEHAIQLQFATRPTTVNIETIRNDYKELLTKYDELITAAATLEVAPPDELSASIVQAADQWRTLDNDDTIACRTASRLLAKLGSKDLAWDYLVTPLSENSGESAPWIALARNLGNEKQVDLADVAWARAYEFETTNPEILLEHAKLLQSFGRTAEARVLLHQVTDRSWQLQYSNVVQEVRTLLQSM